MKNINLESGFTLSELVIGIGILSLVVAMTLATQHQIDQKMRAIDNQIENKIDALGGERVLLYDLQDANLSFNNITILDNNLKSFFDYIPELPINSAVSEPERKLTLSLTGSVSRAEIIVIADDLKAGPNLVYDPVEAYNIGTLPTNINSGSALTFQSVNKNNYIKVQRPNFWIDRRVLFFDTTSRVRPLTVSATAEINMNIPPRSSFYVGTVDVGTNSINGIILLAPYLKLDHPETGDLIDSVDTFLRTVTVSGGGVPTWCSRARDGAS